MASIDLTDYKNLVSNGESAKNAVLKTMYKNGDISQELYDKYRDNFSIILSKRSWYHNWKKLFEADEDGIFVKVIENEFMK